MAFIFFQPDGPALHPLDGQKPFQKGAVQAGGTRPFCKRILRKATEGLSNCMALLQGALSYSPCDILSVADLILKIILAYQPRASFHVPSAPPGSKGTARTCTGAFYFNRRQAGQRPRLAAMAGGAVTPPGPGASHAAFTADPTSAPRLRWGQTKSMIIATAAKKQDLQVFLTFRHLIAPGRL